MERVEREEQVDRAARVEGADDVAQVEPGAPAGAGASVEDRAQDRQDRSVTPDPALADLSPSTEVAVVAPESVYADPAAGIGPASTGETGGWRDVRPGMEVVGSDGESVGLVKEVRTGDFLLDRVMRPRDPNAPPPLTPEERRARRRERQAQRRLNRQFGP